MEHACVPSGRMDGRGDQELYASAVWCYCDYHDALQVNFSNRIPPRLRGLTFHAQLCGRAAALYRSIPHDIIALLKGVDAIIDTLYRCNPLFILFSLYSDLSSLLATKRGTSKSFQNFEFRFCDSISKYSSHPISITLPDSILALMLLYDADVADSQRVPVSFTAAAAASQGPEFKTKQDLIELVTNESMASMIRQRDQGSSTALRDDVGQRTTLLSNAVASHQQRSSRMRRPSHTDRKKLSNDELRDYNLKTA